MLTLEAVKPTPRPTLGSSPQRPCPLCGLEARDEPNLGRLMVRCHDCDLLFRGRAKVENESAYWSKYVDQETERTFDHLRLPFYRLYWRALRQATRRRPDNSKRPRILDVGCVPGTLLNRATSTGWEAHGVELTSELCDLVRSQSNARIWQGHVEAIDFGDVRFDLVVAGDVIRHASDPIAVLKRCHDLLHPGGTLVVREINADHPHQAPRLADPNDFDMQFFTPQTMGRMMEQAGLVDGRAAPSPVSLLTVPLVLRLAHRWPLAYEWLIRAINLAVQAAAPLAQRRHIPPPSFLSIGHRPIRPT